jgi:hypothetical protein
MALLARNARHPAPPIAGHAATEIRSNNHGTVVSPVL